MNKKPWETLPHKVYYSTVTEDLYTTYEIYCDFEQFKDDESLEEFNGDFWNGSILHGCLTSSGQFRHVL